MVFQGDKLPFDCYASRAPGRMKIAWFRSGHMVTTNSSLGVSVYTSRNSDQTIVNHKLVVEKLDSSHAGEWSCVVTTSSGNHTRTVSFSHFEKKGLLNTIKRIKVFQQALLPSNFISDPWFMLLFIVNTVLSKPQCKFGLDRNINQKSNIICHYVNKKFLTKFINLFCFNFLITNNFNGFLVLLILNCFLLGIRI